MDQVPETLANLKGIAKEGFANVNKIHENKKSFSDTLTGAKLAIEHNILTVGDYAAVQLSNISQISIQRKKGTRLLIASVVIFIASITSFVQAAASYEPAGFILLGLLALFISGALFAVYYLRGYFLRLELDSGSSFWLTANMKKDLAFLLRAKRAICECVNHNVGGISLDFSNSTITNSNVLADQSTVKAGDSHVFH